MIDINELRRLLNSADMIDIIDLHANIKPIVRELLDGLEAAEKERDTLRYRCALESQENGALQEAIDRACEERDELRAKIEAMEKQKPVGYMPLATKAALEAGGTGVVWNCRDRGIADEPLYALPGAKGE